jgi:acid phosphatase family membrane protein YuiD
MSPGVCEALGSEVSALILATASSARFGLYTTYFLVATTFLFIVARVVKFDRGLRRFVFDPRSF